MARVFKGVSILIHTIVIAIVSYAQIFNPGLLPQPRSALAYESTPIVVDKNISLPPESRRSAAPASSNANAAPIVAPDSIEKETGHESEPVARAPDGVPIGEPLGRGDGLPGIVVAPPSAPPPAPAPQKPIPVGGNLRPPAKTVHVNPTYPAMAQAVRKEGVVILEVVIDIRGYVETVRVLRSVPMLDDAAVAAVKQWRFEPATLNGQVVPVVMTVTVNFTLTR